MNLSLLTGLAFFLPYGSKMSQLLRQYRDLPPLPVLGSSVHISFTPSSTMLQCLSKAFTRPKSFLLFLWTVSLKSSWFTLKQGRWTCSWWAPGCCSSRNLSKPWKRCSETTAKDKIDCNKGRPAGTKAHLRGPVENSSCSFASLSSGVMSALLAILRVLCISSENFRLILLCLTLYWQSSNLLRPVGT